MRISEAQDKRLSIECSSGVGWAPLDVEAVALATSVAVMAPALTEGGPQKPENLLPPLATNGGFLTAEEASQVCKNREVLAKFVVTANVQPSKIDEQCLRGISKELIRDVINSNFANGLDSLSSAFANGSDLIAVTRNSTLDLDNNGIITKRREKSSVKPGGVGDERRDAPELAANQQQDITIMNDPSASDQDDNMGFFKATVDEPSYSAAAAAIADVNTNNTATTTTNADVEEAVSKSEAAGIDVDQMMPFVGDGAVSDLGQHVEDLLQVIKSMEGEDESMSVVNSEPAPSQGDSVEMFPMPEGFSSFERDLLNDVDVMSLVNDNIHIAEAVDQQQKANNLKAQQDLVSQKQFESERRCAFLLRRMRKLQARIVGRHVAEENTGVIELAHHGVKKYLMQELVNIGAKNATVTFPEISNNLDSFLQKIEKTCIGQSNSVNRQRSYCRYFGAGSREGTLSTSRHPVFGMPQVKVNSEQVESVAGPLATQMHVIEAGLDSDCTASSSGGESCDEMQAYNNPHQQPMSISKRAAWRYAQDRAGVASRWTWLQAQISDLEYKIRQHNEMQRSIRATKGLVVLEGAETINGYSGTLPGSTGRHSPEGELPASRTKPYLPHFYRKRKLLKVDRLHETSKRAAKASTVRCDCDHSLPVCTLCTGRLDPTQPQEPLEQLTVQERIALVDPSFHPVLSFPDEIGQSTHLEAIMKSVEWQQKILRGNLRITRVKDKDSAERRTKKAPEHRQKYTSRLNKSTPTMITARIKRKMLKGKRNRISQDRSLSRKRAPKVPAQIEEEEDASALSSSSKHSSPVPSPLQHTTLIEKNSVKEKEKASNFGRLRQNSYDIDNIVIPYSIAASTRLERLQYKEILTPKWRLCDEPVPPASDVKNGVMQRCNPDSDVSKTHGVMQRCNPDSDCEDVTDEATALRHERSEREESKRFKVYMTSNNPTRIRHSRRTDSRADSGANTPDPMSPHASDFSGDVTSPITSPPATPASAQDSEQQLESHRQSSLQNAFRRRAMSSLRSADRAKEDTTFAGVVEEERPVVLPFEPRAFPLNEETYDKMLEVMPDGHGQASSTSVCSREGEKDEDQQDADMDSESDSTESACCEMEGEDPNDPEWTVHDNRDTEKERIRPTAKR